MTATQRDALMRRSQVRHFGRRQPLFHHGDLADGMYLISSGRVVVRISAPSGAEASLTVIGPGHPVGEQSLLFEGGRRSASALALEPVEALFLSRAEFDRWREADPSVDRLMLRILAARVVRLTDQLVEALFVPAPLRVLRRIVDAASLFGDGVIPLTQEEVATMAGTTRPTVNRTLRAAHDAGMLRLSRGRVVVTDIAALRRHCNT